VLAYFQEALGKNIKKSLSFTLSGKKKPNKKTNQNPEALQ